MMHHQDDEDHHQQHEDHEGHHFKNGMDEHHGGDGEDGGEYETDPRSGQEHDDFGNGFLFGRYLKSALESIFVIMFSG